MNIEFDSNDLEGFSSSGEKCLKGEVEEYKKQLIKESRRLESSRNSGEATEITASMVKDAGTLLGINGYPKKGWKYTLFAFGATVGNLLVGLVFDLDRFSTPQYGLGMSFLIASVLIITYTHIRGEFS